MDINKLTSRKNLVGMILAIIAIVVHLTVGLGPLWPVVAIAAWGLGVVLTPSASQKELTSATPLSDALAESAKQFHDLEAGKAPRASMKRLQWEIHELESHMDDLAKEPIFMKTVTSIAYDHVPGLVNAYKEVPDLGRARADRELEASIEILVRESDKILRAVIDNNLKELGDQRQFLESHFNDVRLYLEDPKAGGRDG